MSDTPDNRDAGDKVAAIGAAGAAVLVRGAHADAVPATPDVGSADRLLADLAAYDVAAERGPRNRRERRRARHGQPPRT